MAWENEFYVVADGVNLGFYNTKEEAIKVCDSLKTFKVLEVWNKGQPIYSKENK